MMTISEILVELSQQGIEVWVDNNNLLYRAPKGAFTPTLRAKISENKTELITLLEQQNQQSTVSALPEIIPNPEDRYQPFPLTDMQQAYWLGQNDSFELGNLSPHLYVEFEFAELDITKLNLAVKRFIARHEMMRAIILPDGQQQILEQIPNYDIEVIDLRGKDPQIVTSTLAETRARMSQHASKTDSCPLFEVVAYQVDERCIRFHISLSLLVFDGGSLKLICRELPLLYQDINTYLPDLEISYRDYIHTLNNLQNSELYNRSQQYWWNRLETLPPAPELPLVKSPGTVAHPQFVRRTAKIDADTWQKLKDKARRLGLTPSGILCASYAEVLSNWSRNSHFILNHLYTNRLSLHPQVNNLIGCFSSTLLLEVNNSLPDTFTARAKRLQNQIWNDFEHSHISGVQVLRELNRQRGGSSRAAAPVVFASSLDARDKETFTQGRVADPIFACIQTPQVWLDHSVMENDGACVLFWDAVEELFPEGLLDDMFNAYQSLLSRLALEESAWQQTSFQMLPPSQLAQRIEVNATQASVPQGMLHTLFADQVSKRLESLAVISSDRILSYSELYTRSNQVGRWLRQLGARPNVLVAVVMEKGWEQVVGVLGSLQSGAAYLPINPSLPKERLWYLLQQSEVGLVLTQSWLDESLEWPINVKRLCIDRDADFATISPAPLEIIQKPEDLAYVIFTSGSTGLPKGVMIDHRGAVNTICDINQRFHVVPDDRVLALSALNFDLSVYDIFGTLAAGASIVIPDATSIRDPGHWAEWLAREKVTIWNSVPALMQMYIEYASAQTQIPACYLRVVMLSGDWIPVSLPDQIKSLIQGVEVFSLGGATEASIWSIIYPIKSVDSSWTSIPYGRPMTNQNFYVLNQVMEPCPMWVTGDLYIGGIGLAWGYWQDEEKTQARFIKHPGTGERLYRTGDLGRYLPDGNIEFLGREDFQVKVQGYRIELGEIETALEQHPGVCQAIVSVVGDRGDKRLVAYIVPTMIPDRVPLKTTCRAEFGDNHIVELITEDISQCGICAIRVPESLQRGQLVSLYFQLPGSNNEICLEARVAWRQWEKAGLQFALTPSEQILLQQSIEYLLEMQGILKVIHGTLTGKLRSFLIKKLPDYMVPSSFTILNSLPLTLNGKVDRKALPTPDQKRIDRGEKASVSPRTTLELQLVQIWEKLLNIHPIGVTDNFFELGGNSLLAVRLMSQIQKLYERELPLSALLQSPTIENLASVLGSINIQLPQSPLVNLQAGIADKLPFFCVHPVGGNILCYMDLSRCLGTEQPFYGLQAVGLTGEKEPFSTIPEMAAHYIAAIQEIQPNGPYLLGGWSMGGVVAFEIAYQMQQQGQEVALLALIDSLAPVHTPKFDDARLLTWFLRDLGGGANSLTEFEDDLRQFKPEKQLHLVLEEAKQANLISPDMEFEQMLRLVKVFSANMRAMADYVPPIYPDRVTLIRASVESIFDPQYSSDETLGWNKFTQKPVIVCRVPGNHFTMFAKPQVDVLTEKLKFFVQDVIGH